MRASGNGNVTVCVNNLLRTFRGEVPYERLKGIDPRLIDQPTETVRAKVQQDARWLIETYEPRAALENVSVTYDKGAEGDLIITAKLQGGEEVSNG